MSNVRLEKGLELLLLMDKIKWQPVVFSTSILFEENEWNSRTRRHKPHGLPFRVPCATGETIVITIAETASTTITYVVCENEHLNVIGWTCNIRCLPQSFHANNLIWQTDGCTYKKIQWLIWQSNDWLKTKLFTSIFQPQKCLFEANTEQWRISLFSFGIQKIWVSLAFETKTKEKKRIRRMNECGRWNYSIFMTGNGMVECPRATSIWIKCQINLSSQIIHRIFPLLLVLLWLILCICYHLRCLLTFRNTNSHLDGLRLGFVSLNSLNKFWAYTYLTQPAEENVMNAK